jgi:antitoxin Phd
MSSWQLQDAKARLSELIDAVEKKGPQIITRRGVETAVVVPIEQWRRVQPKRTLLEVLQSGPPGEFDIPPRGQMRHRKPPEF